MTSPIRKYRELSAEQRAVCTTAAGLCFSACLALGKLIVGLLTGSDLIGVALYTFGLLLAKAECVLGMAGGRKRSLRQRNLLTAAFLLFSSLAYVGFMGSMFFVERRIKRRGMSYVLILAFLSFCELGYAIAGLLRTKNRGSSFRNVKIINFCVALIAILTTQTAILNMLSETETVHIANAFSGIAVGGFIALCALYIAVSPYFGTAGREHNEFLLIDAARNRLTDTGREKIELLLLPSFVYGDYVFRAELRQDTLAGEIERRASLWKRAHVVWKILFCVLSEILLFVWLIGRGILFLRSARLPRKLENLMRENGFQPITKEGAS